MRLDIQNILLGQYNEFIYVVRLTKNKKHGKIKAAFHFHCTPPSLGQGFTVVAAIFH
jgi:hypothetical protein